MQPSSLLLVASSLALFGACALISVRLLRLAWKTREIPERLMGIGLACILFVYFPAMASTGMGRVPVEEVAWVRLALVSPAFVGGFGCLVCFTWCVFRPRERWSVVLAFVLTATAAFMLGGMIAAVHASPPGTGSFEAGQLWSGMLRLPMIVAFAWTMVEGALAHRKARRRLELGLSDPVVTNRFLLWAVVGCAQVVLQTVSTVLHFRGDGMMASPVGLFVVSIGALVGSIAMWLVFLPPSGYVRWVRRRGVVATA